MPPDRRGGDPFLHVMVVQQLAFAHSAQVGKAGAVAHDVADGDPRLAVGAELRPVLGHRGVVVDQSAIRQPMDDGRGHTLVAENTIGAVSADQCRLPRRSDHPVHTSTTGWPSRYTESAPRPVSDGEHGGETPHGTGEARVCGSLHPVGNSKPRPSAAVEFTQTNLQARRAASGNRCRSVSFASPLPECVGRQGWESVRRRGPAAPPRPVSPDRRVGQHSLEHGVTHHRPGPVDLLARRRASSSPASERTRRCCSTVSHNSARPVPPARQSQYRWAPERFARMDEAQRC